MGDIGEESRRGGFTFGSWGGGLYFKLPSQRAKDRKTSARRQGYLITNKFFSAQTVGGGGGGGGGGGRVMEGVS